MGKITGRESKLEIDIALDDTFVAVCAENISISSTKGEIEVTDLCSSSKEYIDDLIDISMDFDVYFDGSSAAQTALEAGYYAGTKFPIRVTREEGSGNANFTADLLITGLSESLTKSDAQKLSFTCRLENRVAGTNA